MTMVSSEEECQGSEETVREMGGGSLFFTLGDTFVLLTLDGELDGEENELDLLERGIKPGFSLLLLPCSPSPRNGTVKPLERGPRGGVIGRRLDADATRRMGVKPV